MPAHGFEHQFGPVDPHLPGRHRHRHGRGDRRWRGDRRRRRRRRGGRDRAVGTRSRAPVPAGSPPSGAARARSARAGLGHPVRGEAFGGGRTVRGFDWPTPCGGRHRHRLARRRHHGFDPGQALTVVQGLDARGGADQRVGVDLDGLAPRSRPGVTSPPGPTYSDTPTEAGPRWTTSRVGAARSGVAVTWVPSRRRRGCHRPARQVVAGITQDRAGLRLGLCRTRWRDRPPGTERW